MSTTKEARFTSGAMRAADEIWGQMSNKARSLSSLSLDSLSGIIDRETAPAEMLSALQNVHQYLVGLAAYLATCDTQVIIGNLDTTIRGIYEKEKLCEAAIQKARGA